ncbi:GH32 C-terminal domain-containing protein, partial [Vibrio parahaemolyticus]|nr:GH32 C-terminal domain-containing protein [Vibrio parahaemolyticus]
TPSVTHQWAGMLSLPRELTLKDGFLVQTPLPELESLRKEEVVFAQSHTLESTSCLIQLDLEGDGFELELSNLKGDNIVFSATKHEFMLDRRHMSHLYAEEFGSIRKAPRLDAKQKIEIYIDNSVIEIFINGGKHTMTSRFFIDDLNTVTLRGLEQARLFPLK